MIDVGKLKKQFARQEWYRQGTAAKPLYLSFPYRTCFNFFIRGKKLPLSYRGMVSYCKGDYMEIYFPFPTMEKIARFYIDARKNPYAFLQELKRRWDGTEAKNFFHEVSLQTSLNMPTLATADLLRQFNNFAGAYQAVWRECIFHDAFDAEGDRLLHQAMQGKNISSHDLHAITSATQLSSLQTERQKLLALTKTAINNKPLGQALAAHKPLAFIQTRFPEFYQKLIQHSRAFHWIYNDYAVVKNLGPQHFLGEIKYLAKNKGKYGHEQAVILETKKIAAQKPKLFKRYKFSGRQASIISALVLLGSWRDARKTCTQIANGLASAYAQEFSRRCPFTVQEIESLYWWEMPLLFSKPREMRKKIQQRKKPLFILGTPEQPKKMLYGAHARLLSTFLTALVSNKKELSGKPAFAGIVTGTVKIIRNQKEFKKMKAGDILVAANTRPEYVPIMKMAGAVITEEGGITSHAAIVSRELKKPCIVGAQGILSRLRDGDRVEVDAGKGSIRLLR